MSEKKIAKAGRLFCVEEGEYSDYQVIGFFVALVDFCPDDEVEAFIKENPSNAEKYKFSNEAFLAFLLAKGFLLEIEYGTFHLADYRNVMECNFTPAPERGS